MLQKSNSFYQLVSPVTTWSKNVYVNMFLFCTIKTDWSHIRSSEVRDSNRKYICMNLPYASDGFDLCVNEEECGLSLEELLKQIVK